MSSRVSIDDTTTLTSANWPEVTVVEAIRTLCLKFPSKQAAMLAFLSGSEYNHIYLP
jgi:hypothetical protein